MDSILDSMMKKAHSFFPENEAEYMALQLARRFGDEDTLWKYLAIFERHPLPRIVEALRQAQGRRLRGELLLRTFEYQLSALAKRQDNAF